VTTYQVQCKVIFMLNGSTREQVVLEHGDIVQVYGAVRGLIVGKQCVPSNLTATVPL
jgi:hypothetical protein